MTWLLSHRYVRYDNQNELKTMKKHIDELRLNKNGFVWWGVIQKSYSKAPINDEKIKCLENQIKNQIETNVFFVENKGSFKFGMREAYRGTLTQIKSFKKPNSFHEESPAYYHNKKHRLWLKLSKIEKIPINSISRLVKQVDISRTTLRLLKVEDYL